MKPTYYLLMAAIEVTMAMGGMAQADELKQASGKVTLLRVHDVGTLYGPASDQIDVEVVFQLDSMPGRAFGFQLRNDKNQPARQGVLDLLRDAFRNDWKVTTDYTRKTPTDIVPDPKNGVVTRLWVTKN